MCLSEDYDTQQGRPSLIYPWVYLSVIFHQVHNNSYYIIISIIIIMTCYENFMCRPIIAGESTNSSYAQILPSISYLLSVGDVSLNSSLLICTSTLSMCECRTSSVEQIYERLRSFWSFILVLTSVLVTCVWYWFIIRLFYRVCCVLCIWRIEQ